MNAAPDRIKELETSVKKAPGSPAFARLADHYRALGHVDDAIALCENGVKQNPGYVTGHLLLGRCYYEKVRVDDAMVEFEAVLKVDRKNIFALKIMGDIAAQKGRKKEAAAFYRKAADYDPRNAALQELFKRFEKYFQDPNRPAVPETPLSPDSSPAAGITDAVRDQIAGAEMIERNTGLSDRDSTDSRILSAAKGVHEEIFEVTAPAPEVAPEAVVSFDDPGKIPAAETSPAAETAPAPGPAPSESPVELEIGPPAFQPSGQGPVSEVISLTDSLSVEPPSAPEPETAAAPEPSSAPEPGLPAPATEMTADTVPPPDDVVSPETPGELAGSDRPAPESGAADNAFSGTEMVDLPPEMTGAREERVGDFKVRKSLLERLMDEQNALLETASVSEAAAEDFPEQPPAEDPPAAPTEPEMSTFAPGLDGYYNVQGEESSDAESGVQLAGIDDVEMREGIDEEALASELPPSPAPEPPPAAPEPVPGVPAILDEVALTREAPPEEAPASAAVAAESADDDQDVSFNDLLQDMDADDEIKRFVETLKSEEKSAAKAKSDPAPTVPGPPAEADAPAKPSEAASSGTPPPNSGISSSAAGMDGFYNVTGESASEDGNPALATDIDQVEIDGALSEEDIAKDANAAEVEPGTAAPVSEDTTETQSPPAQAPDTGEIELGEEIDFEIPTLPGEAQVLAVPPEPEMPAPSPDTPRKEAPRKKADKGKTRTSPRVVSNLATASLGDIYLRQGHKEQALAVFQKILAQDPDNRETKKKIEKLRKEIEEET